MNIDDMPLVELLELQDLIDISNEEGLTKEQDARLQEIVAKYAAARKYYLHAMFFYGQLRWQAAHQGKEEQSPRSPASDSLLGFLGNSCQRAYDFFSHDTPFALLLVFILAGVYLIGTYWLIGGPNQQSDSPSPKPNYVAQITMARGCQWSTSITQPREMMKLQVNQQLELERGSAQITYLNGAEVLLEGPISFTVGSAKSGYITRGKLTVRAETKESRQFTVVTPDARFVDMGTEFGVMIDEKGRAAAAVFEGKVRAEARLANEKWDAPVTLSEGEAVVCNGRKFNPFVAKRSDFPALQRLPPPPPASPYQRWLEASQELQQRQDLLAYYDFQPDPGSPNTLTNRATTGAALNGAIRNAPWVEGRFPDKKALEFTSADAGVRVDLPGEYRQLTVIAWVQSDRLANKYNGILMSDGWRHDQKLHFQLQEGGQMIVDVYGEVDKQENGLDDYCSIKPIPADLLSHWCMIAGVIEAPDRVSLYLNGKFFETLRSSQIPPVRIGEAMIGIWDRKTTVDQDTVRNLSGRLDELMVFTSALTADEIKRIYEAGKP
jgi:hypothetical protein